MRKAAGIPQTDHVGLRNGYQGGVSERDVLLGRRYGFLRVYISVAAVTASGGSALTAGHLEKRNAARPVEASLLAMEVNDDAGCLAPRGALRFFVGTPPGASSLLQSPPPSAIHGRRRLTRHPCRVAHCAEPALGLTGRTPQQRPRRPTGRPVCGVRLSVMYLRLSGRHREQARSHRGLGIPVRD